MRPLTDAERDAVELGLRSADAFMLRRSQILAASARGEHVPRSCAVHTDQAAFTPAAAEHLRALLHRSPRDFGHKTSLWTLALAAEEAFRQGLTAERVSGETIRTTLLRLGVRWLRAKTWITSPDPEYQRKKGGATG